MRRMPIGGVGGDGIGVLAELPIIVVGVTGGEMTPTTDVGGDIGRSGVPASTLEAARTTTAKWATTSIVLAADVCVSNPRIVP